MKDDTISKKAAIDALIDEYHGMISDESMKIYQIINWLSELPPAQQWIPCSERLPEVDRSVLVQLSDDFYDPIQVMTLDISKCEGASFCWRTQEMGINFDMDDVVAWMPLPKPYEGGKDEGKDINERRS
jgi:hypothetical protein